MIRSALLFALTAAMAFNGVYARPYHHRRQAEGTLADAAAGFQVPDTTELTKYVKVGSQLPATADQFNEDYDKATVVKHLGDGFGESFDNTQTLFVNVHKHASHFNKNIMPSVNSFKAKAKAYTSNLAQSLSSITATASTATVAMGDTPSMLNQESKSDVIAKLQSAIDSTDALASDADKLHAKLTAFEPTVMKDAGASTSLAKQCAESASSAVAAKRKGDADSFSTMLSSAEDDSGTLVDLSENMAKTTVATTNVSGALVKTVASVDKMKDSLTATSSRLKSILADVQASSEGASLTDAQKRELQEAVDAWTKVNTKSSVKASAKSSSHRD